jgi:hypothetical protein
MDPTACLRDILRALHSPPHGPTQEDRITAFYRLQDLASWLARGGVPPHVLDAIPMEIVHDLRDDTWPDEPMTQGTHLPARRPNR